MSNYQSGLRGQGVNLPSQANAVGMPPRVFLYTLDQIGVMLDLNETALARHVYFEGRSVGARKRGYMIARNIAPPDAKPEWRIAEREFVRWMKFKGFRYYERGTASN